MDILTEIEQNLVKSGSLFEAEQIILKGVLELGQAIMQNFLESLDRNLKRSEEHTSELQSPQ